MIVLGWFSVFIIVALSTFCSITNNNLKSSQKVIAIILNILILVYLLYILSL